MKRVRVGILGTGAVAGAHIDNWRRVAGAEVAAVCSRDRGRAEEKIAEHGLKNAAAYGDYGSMLSEKDLDVVCICTPHSRHAEETIAAAKAGKHVVIEKPAALNRADLSRMVEAVEEAQVLTSVCFELHWIGSFRNTRALIERGEIGEPFYGEASYYHAIRRENPQSKWGQMTRENGGSAFLTAGCHALDGLIHLMGMQVVEVAAFGATSVENPEGYEYPPNAVAILRFANGAIGKVGVSLECRCPYHFPVIIQGPKGTISDDRFFTSAFPAANGWVHIPSDLPESGNVKDHPYKGQFDHFAECIREGKRPENDLKAAVHVHEVAFLIDESIDCGGTPLKVG